MASGDFIGSFDVSVYKQRLMLPTQFQKKLSPAAKQSFILTLGLNRTIAVFPLDNWNELMLKLKNGTDKQRELRARLFEFAMPEQQLEGPGRLKISDDLIEIANIGEMVKVKGDANFITIASLDRVKSRREQYLDDHDEHYSMQDYQE